MPRRRQLKGCATAIAEMLVSRNFDVSGYWGMGILYRLSRDNKVSSITIDLLWDEHSIWHDTVDDLGKAYGRCLFRLLAAEKIPSSWVKKAKVTFNFNIDLPQPNPTQFRNRGDPFCIEVALASDLDRSFRIKRYGYCDPMGKRFELRSSRVVRVSNEPSPI